MVFEKRCQFGSLYQVGIKGRGPAGITHLGAVSVEANLKAVGVHVHQKRKGRQGHTLGMPLSGEQGEEGPASREGCVCVLFMEEMVSHFHRILTDVRDPPPRH